MTKKPSAARAARRANPKPVGNQPTVTTPIGSQYGGVVVAYPHPVGEVGARFHVSLVDLLVRDAYTNRHVTGHMPMSSGANIVTARNNMVRRFLEETDGQWFWSVDADMVFAPDTLDRLLESACWLPAEEAAYKAEHGKPSGRKVGEVVRPIMGGLCFALMKGDAQEIVPTLYGMSSAQQMVRYNGFPEDTIVPVVGTGAACLLVHRSVFETIAARQVTGEEATQAGVPEGTPRWGPPRPWFAETVIGPGWGDVISEDLTFCLRAGECGIPVHVNTAIEIGHVKPFVIDKAMFFKSLPGDEEPAPTFVVVPVKGKYAEYTWPLVQQLVEQGGFDHVWVYDNAAGTDEAIPENELLGQENVTVVSAAGKSIYQMWNMGVREAINTSTRCNIAILNNDLVLGDEFLVRMARGLRCHPSIAAVSANYDGRDFPEQVQALKGISAGREDGTGGLAGFAFMVRGEIFQAGCPMFDEQFEIWYGDTDFIANLEKANASYGMVKDASVVHVGGGSQTSGDGNGKRLTPDLALAAERDRVKFEAKWAGRL